MKQNCLLTAGLGPDLPSLDPQDFLLSFDSAHNGQNGLSAID